MIEFYDVKDEKAEEDLYRFIIKTDIEKEDEFIVAFSDLLCATIDQMNHPPNTDLGNGRGLEQVHLPFLLKNFADMICKYRGYKSPVVQKTVMVSISGNVSPTQQPSATLRDNGKHFLNKSIVYDIAILLGRTKKHATALADAYDQQTNNGIPFTSDQQNEFDKIMAEKK